MRSSRCFRVGARSTSSKRLLTGRCPGICNSRSARCRTFDSCPIRRVSVGTVSRAHVQIRRDVEQLLAIFVVIERKGRKYVSIYGVRGRWRRRRRHVEYTGRRIYHIAFIAVAHVAVERGICRAGKLSARRIRNGSPRGGSGGALGVHQNRE